MLELAHLLPSEDFEVVVVPGLVRLFAAPDRATRVRLLDQLPRFVDKLPRSLVETQIFGPVSAGFTDANPLVREATIRAMVHLAPCLPSRILNDTLVRHLTTLEVSEIGLERSGSFVVKCGSEGRLTLKCSTKVEVLPPY